MKNLQSIAEEYGKDWTMRLYYLEPKGGEEWKTICNAVCTMPNIDICNAEDIPNFRK